MPYLNGSTTNLPYASGHSNSFGGEILCRLLPGKNYVQKYQDTL